MWRQNEGTTEDEHEEKLAGRVFVEGLAAEEMLEYHCLQALKLKEWWLQLEWIQQ